MGALVDASTVRDDLAELISRASVEHMGDKKNAQGRPERGVIFLLWRRSFSLFAVEEEREGEDEKKKFVEEQTHTVRIEKKKRK